MDVELPAAATNSLNPLQPDCPRGSIDLARVSNSSSVKLSMRAPARIDSRICSGKPSTRMRLPGLCLIHRQLAALIDAAQLKRHPAFRHPVASAL
ncbi:hypothetical protein M513_10171 [Trichuris suis]|uniref:Uncharacterized protein n=1 Tax=Trichuris suis TaxID=68888 RepID=A0A085LVD4_9BILA|nr:hypothetical protein M513_10171 [Trichuris suis]